MSGHKHSKTTYELVFTEGDMAGLLIRVKSLSVGDLLKVSKMAAAMGGSEANLSEVSEIFRVFADCLVSWNLEDDIGEVPSDYDGVIAQDLDFVMKIVTAWMEKVGGGVDPTSQGASNGGATSPAAPPPGLAAASRSLGNSPKPS